MQLKGIGQKRYRGICWRNFGFGSSNAGGVKGIFHIVAYHSMLYCFNISLYLAIEDALNDIL